MGQICKFKASEHVLQFPLIKPKLTFFGSDVDLQQYRNGSIYFFALLVDFQQEFEGIYAMNEVYKGSNVFDLVALQVPNHVPMGISRHFRLLGLNFLNLIFPKIANSCGIGRL